MLERRSALVGALATTWAVGADGKRRCRLGEARGWSLIQVAGFPSTMVEVEHELSRILGGPPPGSVGTAIEVGDVCSMRTGAEQLWIIGRDGDGVEGRMHAAVPPALGVVTPLSHSRTRIVIEGECARDVLMKGVLLDLHPDVFGVHRFAMTGIHHTPVLIHRVGPDRYDLYAMRTFAQSVWEWLTDAALEFGYDVATFDSYAGR